MKKEVSIDYLCNEREGQYLDRKSARIKPTEVARHLVAFSNANGGILAIGIEDNGAITGFNYDKANSINDFLYVPFSCCQGNLMIETEIIEVNEKQILLFFIDSVENNVIKTSDNKVYLRIGDKSKLLTHNEITQLEYDKGDRSFEDLVIKDSSFDDVDIELLLKYKHILNTNLSLEEILESRSLMKEGHLTVAGVLLFSKYPTKFLPQARLRLLKYDGTKMETGRRLNLIKEINYEYAIPKIIEEVRQAINFQLREFQYLDKDGLFKIIPEYPEFAWFEGIVNSLTHRNYSIIGDYIRVSLYDDRLEIFSPGKLPNIVTLDNMKNTRYSRNPRIARVLSEFGWVKELNEGVKRIYDEMDGFYLNNPTYSEPNRNSVLLVLENSITSRTLRVEDRIQKNFDESVFNSLNEYEIKIVQFLMTNEKITVKIASSLTKRSDVTSRNNLKQLESIGILQWHGSNKKDPTQYYTLSPKYK